MNWTLLPPYLLAIAGVAGGLVSILKWRSDSSDQEERQKNEAVAQTMSAYKETITQLDKRVDQAEAAARLATERANIADARLLTMERSHAACERRNVELTAMLELMRTVLNDRGIHIPAFGTQADTGPQSQPGP